MKRIIGFTVAVILAITLTTACTLQAKRQHTAACRHECLFVASVLAENYGYSCTVIMVGPTEKPFETHCQAAVQNDGGLTYFSAWGSEAVVESRQHNYFTPDKEYSIHEFLNTFWRRRHVAEN